MSNTMCGECLKKIYPKQKYNLCKGDCKTAFHLDCAEIMPDDRIDSILDILKSLQSEISAMREEISSLKLENTEMKTDISNYILQNKLPNSVLDSTLSSSAPLSGNSSPNNPMTSAKSQKEVTKITPNTTKKIFAKVTRGNPPKPSSNITSANPTESSEDEFQIVSHRRRRRNKPLIECKGTNDFLQSAKKPPRSKAIFVTRLAPGTSQNLIENHLKSNIKIPTAICSKLKTKHDTYSSFHISVEESDIDKIMDPNSWPEGALLTTYFGKLNEEQKYVPLFQNPTASSKELHTDISTTSAASCESNSKNEVIEQNQIIK